MRTRTLLLAVAALAAGLVTSQAQVYSQNIVGYINITLKPGYNLVANQLVNGTNGLNQVMGTMPNSASVGYQIYKWNPASQGFGDPAGIYVDGFGWADGQLSGASTATVSPGEGFFLQNQGGTDQTITLTGQVTTGNSSVTVNTAYGFYSSVVPDGSSFDNNGFPAQDGMTYYAWQNNGTSAGYASGLIYYAGAGWSYNAQDLVPAPQPAVGQGFVIFNPGSSQTWTRNFNP